MWVFIAAWLLRSVAAAPPELPDAIRHQIDVFLGRERFSLVLLKKILQSGDIHGHFDTNQTLGVFHYLGRHFPQFLNASTIGKTSQGREIEAFELSANGSNDHETKALLAATYHARELTCTNFLIGVLLKFIHHLIHNPKNYRFFDFSTVVFVPVVNLDAHFLISEEFKATGIYSDKRKNMNAIYCP